MNSRIHEGMNGCNKRVNHIHDLYNLNRDKKYWYNVHSCRNQICGWGNDFLAGEPVQPAQNVRFRNGNDLVKW